MVLMAIIIVLLLGMWYVSNRLQFINTEREKMAQLVSQQQAELENIQLQRMQTSALDNKVTLELINAKSEIERLRTDLGNNAKRLLVNARCSTLPKAAAGESNATRARLNDSAERDYLSLRERIVMANTMINGLQDYIRHQCLK